VNADIVNLDASKITTGILVVARTEAKCTNPNADQTSASPQPHTWLSNQIELAKLGTSIIVGGYIKASLLTADNIVTGTLTGRKIRTAVSGDRIEITITGDSSPHAVAFFKAGTLRGLMMPATTGMSVGSIGTGKSVAIGNDIQGTGMIIYGDQVYSKVLKPIASTDDLGDSGSIWRYLHVKIVDFFAQTGDPTPGAGVYFFHSGTDHFRGHDGVNFRDICFYDERDAASPILTFESGLAQLKKIKAPTMLTDLGLCYDTKAFPKEFRITLGARKKEHIDLKPVIGMLIKGQKELLERVENLEK